MPDLQISVKAYQSALDQRNALDFDDLIRLPVELLADEKLRQNTGDRFTYIIVDEYQDINPAQYRLLRLLTPEQGQSLRGRRFRPGHLFLPRRRPEELSELRKGLPRRGRIDLSLNYRSPERSCTLRRGSSRKTRSAWQDSSRHARGRRPHPLYSVPDDRGEGAAIIDEIELRMGGMTHETGKRASREAVAGRPCRFSDFAVIYRTNVQARALEEAFAASGIPFQVIGKPNSMQRKEAEETLAFLRSLATRARPEARTRPEHGRGTAADGSRLLRPPGGRRRAPYDAHGQGP